MSKTSRSSFARRGAWNPSETTVNLDALRLVRCAQPRSIAADFGGSVKMRPKRFFTREFMKCFKMTGLIFASVVGLAAGTFAAESDSTSKPTFYIIGDSTVKNGTKGQKGWGEVIGEYFDLSKITVANHAIGGRSSRTFLTEGRWEKIMAELKPGDFVIMQFGHNDGGALDDPARARGSIRGTGEETREIDNPILKKKETVHTYGWYLRKYVADAKSKGATPLVCSPVPRNIWKDGKVARASNDYGKWAMEVARAEGVAFVDLNEIIARHLEALGEEKVNDLFFGDHTHASPEGAKVNAAAVVEGLRALPECAVCRFLKSEPVPAKTKSRLAPPDQK